KPELGRDVLAYRVLGIGKPNSSRVKEFASYALSKANIFFANCRPVISPQLLSSCYRQVGRRVLNLSPHCINDAKFSNEFSKGLTERNSVCVFTAVAPFGINRLLHLDAARLIARAPWTSGDSGSDSIE